MGHYPIIYPLSNDYIHYISNFIYFMIMISLYIHYLALSHGLYKVISKWAHQGPSGTENLVKSGAFGGDILGTT